MGMCAAQEGRVRTGKRATSMVGKGQSVYGAHLGWIASFLEPCLWRLMSEDGRSLGLCCVHVDDFLVALDRIKNETRQHFDAPKQQFQLGSWEDADFTICGVHFRQDFVHNQWGRNSLGRA